MAARGLYLRRNAAGIRAAHRLLPAACEVPNGLEIEILVKPEAVSLDAEALLRVSPHMLTGGSSQ